jgi:hypothetical protein
MSLFYVNGGGGVGFKAVSSFVVWLCIGVYGAGIVSSRVEKRGVYQGKSVGRED